MAVFDVFVQTGIALLSSTHGNHFYSKRSKQKIAEMRCIN